MPVSIDTMPVTEDSYIYRGLNKVKPSY